MVMVAVVAVAVGKEEEDGLSKVEAVEAFPPPPPPLRFSDIDTLLLLTGLSIVSGV